LLQLALLVICHHHLCHYRCQAAPSHLQLSRKQHVMAHLQQQLPYVLLAAAAVQPLQWQQ
jgi:hypothetical protein